MKKINKLKGSIWVILFFGITFTFFVWISWQKLHNFLGNGWLIWVITGGIVLIGIVTGIFSINKIVSKFT
jgi:hypothetical protein